VVSLLWAIFSFASVTVYPIIEERRRLLSWVKDLAKFSKRQDKEESAAGKEEHEVHDYEKDACVFASEE